MEQVKGEVENKLSDTWFQEPLESSSATFLLKVSGGRHSGAVMPLTPGKYSLGQDQECDFIFLDDAFLGGRILLDVTVSKILLSIEGNMSVTVSGKPAAGPQTLESFEPVEIGATRFALGPAKGPWPEPPKPAAAETPKTPEPDAEAADKNSGKETEPKASKRRGKKMRLLAIVSSAIPIVASGLYLALESAKPKPNPAADIRSIISQMHLSEVTLEDSTQGFWVKGFVPTESDRNLLLARLTAYNPAIRSRIISAEETRGSVQGVLDLYHLDFDMEIAARGKVVLRGVYDDAPRLKEILESVKQGVQSETEVESKIVTTASVFPALNRMLAEKLLNAKIRIEAEDGKIVGMLAKNKVDPKELETWKGIKESFKARYELSITDKWTEKLSPTLIKFALAARELETQLAGVTVGELSYLSMKKGGKYFEGARLKSGPFVRSIQKDRIVLTVDGLEDTYYIRKDTP